MNQSREEHPQLDRRSRELEEALLEFIRVAPAGFERHGADRAACYGVTSARLAELDATFECLALDLFAYQYERVPVYRKWANAVGHTPETVSEARRVPALPVEAWRETRVATFEASRECAAFETSGTTAAQTGVLHLDSLALYDASLERGFKHHVMPDRERMQVLRLVPELLEAPRSSLAYMLQRVRERFGTDTSDTCIRGGRLDGPRAFRHLEECRAAHEPVVLLGTAFAFVQLLDACEENAWRIELPPGSRLFETGGYKGRTRELSRARLYDALSRGLGIPTTHMVSEYGMTELGSQYYTLSLRQALCPSTPAAGENVASADGAADDHQSVQRAARGIDCPWSAPFWLRPSILHSERGVCEAPSDARAPGLLAHHDLSNRGSVAHVLCADLGQPDQNGFTLLGRAPRAPMRGCGLTVESTPAPRARSSGDGQAEAHEAPA